MNFNSLEFLIFLPIVLILYYITPKKLRYLVLLVASYFFYMQWNIWLAFLMLGVTLISYFSAIIIDKTFNIVIRKLTLVITLALCFSVLIIFKYLDFALSGITALFQLFGNNAEFSPLKIILPVGISFYTFQSLSYVIDVYRKSIPAELHLGYFALFVSFFPQLVAGPIERPENLLPQLKSAPNATKENISSGIHFMISGFVKKVAIADLCALIVNPIYENYASHSGFALIIATLLFAIQIYCDFSGYSEIAIGCAAFMGIKLMKNFDCPYLATNIRDFWKRWHISLTKWFTDYLYIPLGGNRKGKLRTYLNIFIVFMVSGLWHGANLTFVAWGCIHGIYLIISRILYQPKKHLKQKLNINENATPVHIAETLITFLLVCFAWIFFRSENLQAAGIIIEKIFTSPFTINDLKLIDVPTLLFIYIPLAIFILFCLRYMPQIYTRQTMLGENTAEYNISAITFYFLAIIFIFVSWVSLTSLNGTSEFIYFQF